MGEGTTHPTLEGRVEMEDGGGWSRYIHITGAGAIAIRGISKRREGLGRSREGRRGALWGREGRRYALAPPAAACGSGNAVNAPEGGGKRKMVELKREREGNGGNPCLLTVGSMRRRRL